VTILATTTPCCDHTGDYHTTHAHSRYFHIGGDEVKFPCWNQSTAIRKVVSERYGNLSSASFELLQAEWTANVSAAAVTEAGKTAVLWQPTAEGPGDAAWDNALPSDALYMIWLNAASAKAYAEAGKNVIFTTPFYVAGMGANGWNNVYNAPIIPANISAAARARFVGAEVCMWGESQGTSNTFMRAFQIGAGAAESFWRAHDGSPGPGSATGLGTSDRFNRFLCHLKSIGIDAPPIMPGWCGLVSRV